MCNHSPSPASYPFHLNSGASLTLTDQRGVPRPMAGACGMGAYEYAGPPGSFASGCHVILPHTPDDDFERMMAGRWATLMTGGHVHLQWLRRRHDSLFFNPGSVGLAYDHQLPDGAVRFDPWAEYAMVTATGEGGFRLEFRRAPFDPHQVVEATIASGMPHAEETAQSWQALSSATTPPAIPVRRR